MGVNYIDGWSWVTDDHQPPFQTVRSHRDMDSREAEHRGFAPQSHRSRSRLQETSRFGYGYPPMPLPFPQAAFGAPPLPLPPGAQNRKNQAAGEKDMGAAKPDAVVVECRKCIQISDETGVAVKRLAVETC